MDYNGEMLEMLPAGTNKSALVDIEGQRAIQEVHAAAIVAKKFPRDTDEAYTRIMKSCERKSLAESACYAYPRGGQMGTGPSIRLAEVLAQNWGNMKFGIRELSNRNGESEVEVFAWDIETNVYQSKTFSVKHIRTSKKQGITVLTDPRDIYEMVANQGARRLRACILGIIPGDITDAAVKRCEDTLASGNKTPLEDRVRKMLELFAAVGATKEMVEGRIGHKTASIIETELLSLGKIYNSVKDGMSKISDWFAVPETDTATGEKTEKFKGKAKKPEKTDELPALAEARKVAPDIYDEAVANLPAGVSQEEILKKMNRIIDTGERG